MERKRVLGRFVREGADEVERPGEKEAALRAPRPRQCRTFTRKRIAEALPEIVKKFVEEAKKGSCPHLSELRQMLKLPKEAGESKPRARRRGPSLASILMKELEKTTGGKTAHETREEE